MTERESGKGARSATNDGGDPTPHEAWALEETAARGRAMTGVMYGLGAYGVWGLAPIYFKAIKQVPALEVLAHRVVWSVILLSVFMVIGKQWGTAREALRSRRVVITLMGSTLLVATNWTLFIWAVAHDQLLAASFGYYINPLINVVLGVVLLGERLRLWQMVGVGLATIGVVYQGWMLGEVPAIAMVLAVSFGLYGLLRKTAHVDSLVGLTLETMLLGPAALAYLIYLGMNGRGTFGVESRMMDVLLSLSGVMTAVSLLWFAAGARRLKLTTMGFLQYIAPSGQFLLAVLAYHEPITRGHLVSFGFIWTALAVYSVDAAVEGRRMGRTGRGVEAGSASITPKEPT